MSCIAGMDPVESTKSTLYMSRCSRVSGRFIQPAWQQPAVELHEAALAGPDARNPSSVMPTSGGSWSAWR